MPFKIFVLAAGVSKVKLPHFIAAIAIGRGTRYFGEGLLAVFYGEAAADFLKDNARPIAMVFAALCLVGGIGYFLWRRRREGRRTMA
jgi:LPXTG-motif cell wall-anchored protein